MKKITSIAMALSLCAGLQAQVVSSEKTVHTESTNNNGAVQTTTEHHTETHVTGTAAPAVNSTVKMSPAYLTRLESAYKAADVSAADIARLRAIDAKVIEARKADPNANLKTYYVEQQRILKPAQVTKVRTYLTEHRLPETVPSYEVTTYETVPTAAGVHIDTPIGSVGVGVPTGSKTVETHHVVPAQP